MARRTRIRARLRQASPSPRESPTCSSTSLTTFSSRLASTSNATPITSTINLSALEAIDSCPRAQSLVLRIRDLEAQLQTLRSDRDNLQQQFESSCRATLQTALDSLQTLVNQVTEADNLILLWYRKPAMVLLRISMKLLKPVGHDRDVHTLMARKSGGIRARADEVSEAFELCGDVCQDSLGKVQELHLRTDNFVHVGIGGLQNDAQDLAVDYERKKRDLQLSIDQKGLDVDNAREEAAKTRRTVRELEGQQMEARRAARSSKALGAVGIGGGILLGALCLVFPPAGAVAAGVGAISAGAVGVSSAVVASDHSADARRIGYEQQRFEDQLDSLEYELRCLRRDMSSLEDSQSGYDLAVGCARDLETGCEQLRSRTNQFLQELNGARLILSQGITKTRGLAADLQRCEYARTRRDIVSRVQGVLEEYRMCTTGGRLGMITEGTGSQLQLDVVAGQLRAVQRKTDRVVCVLNKALR